MELHARHIPTGPWAIISFVAIVIILALLADVLIVCCYRSRKRARAARQLLTPPPSALPPASNQPQPEAKTARKFPWWPLTARRVSLSRDEEAHPSSDEAPLASAAASTWSASTVAVPPPLPTSAPSKASSTTSRPAKGRSRAASCVSIHAVLVEGDVRRKGYEGWHGGEPLVVVTPAEEDGAGRTAVVGEAESEKEVVGVARAAAGGRKVVV